MNPVKELVQKLKTTQSPTGTVIKIQDDTMLITTENGNTEPWPIQSKFKVGDTVIIHNGKLAKIPTIKHIDIFEV